MLFILLVTSADFLCHFSNRSKISFKSVMANLHLKVILVCKLYYARRRSHLAPLIKMIAATSFWSFTSPTTWRGHSLLFLETILTVLSVELKVL